MKVVKQFRIKTYNTESKTLVLGSVSMQLRCGPWCDLIDHFVENVLLNNYDSERI